jgi:hypothetical protein
MGKSSEAILALKPVSFRYKKHIDPQGAPQCGLVAEEVEKVNPELIIRDQEGKPHMVRYEQINAMLLNEFLKAHRKMETQDRKLLEQEATIAELKCGMQALTATLGEQTAELRQVRASLQIKNSAAQFVVSDQ